MKNSDSKKAWLSLLAGFLIPLSPSPQWVESAFSEIPSNKVRFAQNELVIEVRQSASPLFYRFKNETKIQSVNLLAEIVGHLAPLPKKAKQGQRGSDDFVLRLGLVVEGTDRMNWLQRQIAPQWLIDLEAQLPPDKGVQQVLFLTTCRQDHLLNKTHSHYLNAKLQEICVSKIEDTGAFRLRKNLPEALSVIGLWIASDGDDLKSEFELKIKKIEISDSKKSW